MSILSKYIFDPLKNAFHTAATAGGGASATDVATATANITQAQTLVAGSITALANIGVNYILSLVPGGAAYAGLVDEFLDAVIAGLQAKKSTPPTS